MTGEQVKQILKQNSFELSDIATKLGIPAQNLHSLLKTSDMKIGQLEQIAKAINKSVYFFLYYKYQRDMNKPDNPCDNPACHEKIKYLETIISDLRMVVALQEKIINIQNQKVNIP